MKRFFKYFSTLFLVYIVSFFLLMELGVVPMGNDGTNYLFRFNAAFRYGDKYPCPMKIKENIYVTRFYKDESFLNWIYYPVEWVTIKFFAKKADKLRGFNHITDPENMESNDKIRVLKNFNDENASD